MPTNWHAQSQHPSLSDRFQHRPFATAEGGVRDASTGAGSNFGLSGGGYWRPPMQQGFRGSAHPGPQHEPWRAPMQGGPAYGPAPSYRMPIFNLTPGMMGGGGKLGQASWENPNAMPFLSDVMGHNVNMAGLASQDYRARIGAQSAGDVARVGAGAQMYGAHLGHLSASEQNAIARMRAEAEFGEGGLAGRQMTLQEQRPAWEAEQAALQRQFGTEQQARQLASQEKIADYDNAFMRELMRMPMFQNVLMGGAGGISTAPGGMQHYGGGMGGGGMGPNEAEFLSRDRAAQGRRAADEAAMIQNDVAAATGPGGAGMGGGPARSAAGRRAQLMRLQAAASERAADKDRLQQMYLAQRGQDMGFAGGLFR